ncbi:MAG: HypC/HybG/HupF family hydrogenase formation chaperone [Nitrospina sp.]|nr:HypC/HybG/HupF family hydrogenase formation chaperone [Nitrospina sp.]
MCLAVPGKVLEVSGDEELMKTGRVSFGGTVREVNLAYVPQVEIGDYVVVHVGFAISILNESEARRVFDDLESLEEPEIPEDAA